MTRAQQRQNAIESYKAIVDGKGFKASKFPQKNYQSWEHNIYTMV